MQQSKNTDSRKKFLLWGAAVLSSLTFFKIIPGRNKKPDGSANETMKMLTQDGKLVEIDKSRLASGGKKITDTELQQWIRNKPAQN